MKLSGSVDDLPDIAWSSEAGPGELSQVRGCHCCCPEWQQNSLQVEGEGEGEDISALLSNKSFTDL